MSVESDKSVVSCEKERIQNSEFRSQKERREEESTMNNGKSPSPVLLDRRCHPSVKEHLSEIQKGGTRSEYHA